MSSLSQLSSTVKQVDEDSTEQFITQLIINVEEHILLHHVNKLLALPMIQHIIQIPTPEPSGQIKKGFAETCYSTAGLPYNMAGRIIGPRGCTVKAIQLLCGCGIELNFIKYNLLLIQISVEPDYESIIYSSFRYPFDVAKRIIGPNSLTVKAIQNICECRIQLLHEKNNTIKVMVFAENDYDSILIFKLWKAFQCINCLLEIHPFYKDIVGEIQQVDSQFWERQMEIIFNICQCDSMIPPLLFPKMVVNQSINFTYSSSHCYYCFQVTLCEAFPFASVVLCMISPTKTYFNAFKVLDLNSRQKILNLSSLWRSFSKFLMLTLKEKILSSATSPLLICDGRAAILGVQRSLLHLAAQYIF
ncbi:hypothetical protein T07_6390 [Trichinella nelsoni]|uniref:K Homology domain-containing protein n=1 Tax=Trichinella nelsoni TaxID=6336 RepID=A0A0V0RI59_9BILA|nr:hypothetical protein T07_6390 [Trichinella nelsoni]